MAWRDAWRATAVLMTSSHSATVTMYFFYSIIWTMIGLYVVIRLDQVLSREEQKVISHLESKDECNSVTTKKRLLLKYAVCFFDMKFYRTFL